MPYFKICPKCNSDDVTSNEKRNEAPCNDCGFTGEDREPEVHYFPASRPEVRNFCRELADQADWAESAFETWPGPVAHEYYRLKELLTEGQIIGAIWQLKDLAEVFIKFPAVVMACDVLEHNPAEEAKRRVRESLFGKRPRIRPSHLSEGGAGVPRPLRSGNPSSGYGILQRSAPF